MRQRVAGVIVKNGRVLLWRRVKADREYYVFPGGGVEAGESLQEALKRELKEELELEVEPGRLIYKHSQKPANAWEAQFFPEQTVYYFLVTDFAGQPRLGGPEKERMKAGENLYFIHWVKIEALADLDKLYPQQAKQKIADFLGRYLARRKGSMH